MEKKIVLKEKINQIRRSPFYSRRLNDGARAPFN